MAMSAGSKEAAAAIDDDDDDDDSPPKPWESKEDRQDFLDKCHKDAASRRPDPEDEARDLEGELLKARIAARMEALKKVRTWSRTQDNAYFLAADAEVLAAVVFCACPPDPGRKKSIFADVMEESTVAEQSVAISCLTNFLASPTARPLLAGSAEVRHAVVTSADSAELPRELCAKAFPALGEVSLTRVAGTRWTQWSPPVEKPVYDDPLNEPLVGSSESEVCAAMLRAAAAGEPSAPRAAALGALWSSSISKRSDPRAMWESPEVRKAALDGADPSSRYEVRESALGLLWSFAVIEENKMSMWKTTQVREVLRDGLAPQRPVVDKEKTKSQSSQRSHAFDEQEPLSKRPSLHGLPKVPPEPERQPVALRTKALGVLISLVQAEGNRRSMWEDKKLLRHLIQAVCVTPALAKRLKLSALQLTPLITLTVYSGALQLLVLLGSHGENKEDMCRALVPEILADAAENELLPFGERRAIVKCRKRLLGEDREGEGAAAGA